MSELNIQMRIDGGSDIVRERVAGDFYETPAWLVQSVLDTTSIHVPNSILDPGAGRGALSRAAVEWFHDRKGVRPSVTAVECDEERFASLALQDHIEESHHADFLEWAWDRRCVCTRRGESHSKVCRGGERYDLVVCNPPFVLWTHFVDAARSMLSFDGTLLVLGFSNILASADRHLWWRDLKPYVRCIWQSSVRPKFRKDSTSGDPRETIWLQIDSRARTRYPMRPQFDWLPL